MLDGTARLALDDEVVELKKRDAVRMEPGVMRCVEAGPDGVEILAFNAAPPSRDVDMQQGWWPE